MFAHVSYAEFRRAKLRHYKSCLPRNVFWEVGPARMSGGQPYRTMSIREEAVGLEAGSGSRKYFLFDHRICPIAN